MELSAVTAWLSWLERTAVATAVRESVWLYPAVETAHILAFVMLVGSAAMWDLRLLGLSRTLSVTGMERHLLRSARVGFALAAPTGFLLFMTDATQLAANPAFQLKLVLVLAAVLNAAAFHRWTFKSVAAWDRDGAPPPAARLAAVLSLSLWTMAVVCGRLIAYV